MPNTNTVAKHYNKARQIALNLIVLRARRILKKHKNLKEFVMAMGSATFHDQKGDAVFNYTTGRGPIYMDPVYQLIEDWDDYLKLTGEPMRFCATGRILRDW